MIRVIETTTAERKAETITLFEKIKPYLNQGYSFKKALEKETDLSINFKNGWFKDLINYAKTQGYDYHEYKFKRPKNNNI